MNKVKIKEILKRYTKSLYGASGETIITNYGKMRDFTNSLDKEELGEELCTLCSLFTIHQALKAVETEKISLKNSSTDWNSKAVAKGYQLAKECKQTCRDEGHSKLWTEKMRLLIGMAKSEQSIATQLCLMGLLFSGKVLSDDDLVKLKDLLSEEPSPMN